MRVSIIIIITLFDKKHEINQLTPSNIGLTSTLIIGGNDDLFYEKQIRIVQNWKDYINFILSTNLPSQKQSFPKKENKNNLFSRSFGADNKNLMWGKTVNRLFRFYF